MSRPPWFGLDLFSALDQLREFLGELKRDTLGPKARSGDEDRKRFKVVPELTPLEWRNPPSETITSTLMPLAVTASEAAAARHFAARHTAAQSQSAFPAGTTKPEPKAEKALPSFDQTPAKVLPVGLTETPPPAPQHHKGVAGLDLDGDGKGVSFLPKGIDPGEGFDTHAGGKPGGGGGSGPMDAVTDTLLKGIPEVPAPILPPSDHFSFLPSAGLSGGPSGPASSGGVAGSGSAALVLPTSAPLGGNGGGDSGGGPPVSAETLTSNDIRFVANDGQWDPAIDFVARTGDCVGSA